MLATLVTFFAAIAAVFTIVLVWVGIDRLAHKNLGERNRCCHTFDADDPSGAAAGCCGKHESCELRDDPGGRPAYTIRRQ